MTVESRATSSAQLAERLVAIERVIVQAGERIPSTTAAELEAHLQVVRERLEAGVDFTVVALVGGTGSGKSSLFNALTGIDFARVGVKRPTTSEPLACVWGEGADRLLDHLEIASHNRFQRESELDVGTEDELRGLVLIDVPDHDSVAAEHREIVDQIVPLVDVLIWVLDPQKYADAAVHGDYLQQLRGQEASLLVALNKIDTVPAQDLRDLQDDLARLLRADGLHQVTISPVSTVTEAGIQPLRDLLSQLTQTRSAAAERAAVELRAAGELLAPTVAESEPRDAELPTAAVIDALGQAGDFLALEARMRDSLQAAKSAEELPIITAEHPVDADLVDGARSKYIEAAIGDLPELWAQSVTAGVPPTSEITVELHERMQRVENPAPAIGLRRARVAVSALLGLLFIIAVGWAGWILVDSASAPETMRINLPGISEPLARLAPGLEVPLLSAALTGVALVVSGFLFRSRLRALSRERARDYGESLRRLASDLVRERVSSPVRAIHNSHREVREVILRVRSELAGSRPADVVKREAAD